MSWHKLIDFCHLDCRICFDFIILISFSVDAYVTYISRARSLSFNPPLGVLARLLLNREYSKKEIVEFVYSTPIANLLIRSKLKNRSKILARELSKDILRSCKFLSSIGS